MSSVCYIVHLEEGCPSATFYTPEKTLAFLKTAGFISIFRYNDKETGVMYARAASEYCLSAAEQEQRPVFVMASVSDEGVFVPNESFWTENYMLGEFYNPERTPYIEQAVPQEDNAY